LTIYLVHIFMREKTRYVISTIFFLKNTQKKVLNYFSFK